MMRSMRWLLLAGAALLLSADRTAAQLAWDSPYLVPPGPVPGIGIYLMDVHGGDLGVMGMWRSPRSNYGLRGGIAESADDVGIMAGIDFAGDVTRASAEFPLDIDWVFGAGLGVADWVRVSVPLGLTMGHTFRDSGAAFTPYITPRIVFDALFTGDDDGRRDDDSETDLDLAVDLGLDLRLPRTGFAIRFGGTLADREAVAIGLVF